MLTYRPTTLKYIPGDALPGSFARASVATYRDVDGAVQTVAADVARDGHYVDGERTLLLDGLETLIGPDTQNGDFESGALSPWVAFASGSSSFSVSAAAAWEGVYGGRLSVDASNSYVEGRIPLTLIENQEYQYELMARLVSGTGGLTFRLDASSPAVGPDDGVLGSEWSMLSGALVYGGASSPRFQVSRRSSPSSANAIIDIDAVRVRTAVVETLEISAAPGHLLRTRYYDLATETWEEEETSLDEAVILPTGRAYSEITLLGESRPVLTFPPDWSRMAARQLDELRIESAGAGIAVPWSAGTAIRRRGEFALTLHDRAAIAELVDFHAGRRGQRKGFWAPTWLGDFRLLESAAAGASELTIEAVGLAGLIAAHGEQFRHLALVRGAVWTGAEAMELHRIDSVASAGETEVITLDAPLAAAIDHRETLACPLLFARFSKADLTLRYRSDAAAQVSVGLTELPREYVTPRDGDAPVWLYEFARGAQTWRFADWGATLVRAGETWEAASIAHGGLRSNAELLADPVEITASTDDDAHALRALAAPDLRRVTVKIHRADADDAALLDLEFRGELIGRAVQRGGKLSFEVATALAARDTVSYPRTAYDRYDNRHVYDSGVTEATYTTAGTIAAVGSDWIEAPEFGAKATAEADGQWFAYGFVRVGAETRMCRYQDGDRLYLDSGFAAAELAGAVEASAGYDRSLFTRDGKFNDAAGHRGFAYMPDRNLLFEPLEVQQEVSTRKK